MGPSVQQAEHLLISILVQLVIMIAAARLLNTLLRRAGQPGVIGEIIAGLALGPSLLGAMFPDLSRALFPAAAAPTIGIISQIGLILLMFQIGASFEFSHLANARNRTAAIAIAVASIGVPLGLGLLLGTESAPALAPGKNPLIYGLFFGVALAITAVPILGRILREFELNHTEIGVVAISAAALNDVVGWILLAGVASFAQANFSGAHVLGQMVELAVFAAALHWMGRPMTDRLLALCPLREGTIPPNLMAAIVCVIFVLGMTTFELGIFTIFGGFAAGLLFHRHHAFVEAWQRQVGQFVLVFFLPVFFTFTGLRTNILGLGQSGEWAWLAIILAVAIAAKIVPVFVAGRLIGFGTQESAILGTLMNTRALMELIVLNVGFDLGFLPQNVFTMLVIMAIATTIMTGPILKILLPRAGFRVPVDVEA